jgi:hypothetical protein
MHERRGGFQAMEPKVFREMVDVMAKRGGPYAGMAELG